MGKRLMGKFQNVALGGILLFAALLVMMALQLRTLTAQAPATGTDGATSTAVEPLAPLAVSQVLSYQARMLDPGTGAPKPDGDYQITFSIYNVATGGSPLWTETKSVSVSNGFLTTLLGSTTALTLNNFNGQELFLGITLAGDPEMTPRQRLAHTAYAMFAENATKLDGVDSAGFAPASHSHSGAAITSGTVAAARIDGAVARDAEIVPVILAADGASSGLDADLLDGLDSGAFYPDHRGTQVTNTLGAGNSATWTTHSWPLDWHMLWTAVPTSTSGEVKLDISVLLEANGLYTYRLTVTNISSVTTNYSIRYAVLR